MPHCDIIQGCATIKFYTDVHTTICQILPFYWWLMATATILSTVSNFVTCGDHTYKVIWTLDIGGHSEMWVKDGDDHNTFVVVVIMTEYIAGHVLKAIICHHLLLTICTCSTIQGCATIKINHENKLFVLE